MKHHPTEVPGCSSRPVVSPSGRRVSPSCADGSVGRAAISTAVALTLAACTHDAPTAPKSAAATASRQMAAAAPDRSGIGSALDDASIRLLPSVADIAAHAQLNGYLRDLSAQLDAGDTDKARRSLALARKALEANAKIGEPADLAAIGLALDQVEALLQSDAATAQR
jgi:hypothetical protein